MSTIQDLEAEISAQDANLKEIEEILAVMPDSEDALEMQREVLANKKETQKKIALLKPSDAASPDASHDVATLDPFEEHIRLQTDTPNAAPVERRVFKVNETVSAKYAADKQFYPATVVSMMGAAHAPIYTVRFKGYNETATVRGGEIRPIIPPASSQKRKADGSLAVTSIPATTPTPTPFSNGSVMSAPAHIDTALAETLKKEPSKTNDGLSRSDKPPKKVKTNKALDKAKGNWQDWQKKAGTGKIAKAANKESMFRTGEGHSAKVGFTGSGKTMTKDVDRSRHKFDLTE